jgi:hypothetical protein
MNQAALAHQAFPGHQRERSEGASPVRGGHLRVDRHHQEGAQLDASLYTGLQVLSVSVFGKTQLRCALQSDESRTDRLDDANQLILFNI